jgi:hypothetical protein
VHSDTFKKSLLSWKMSVSVRACVRVCVCVDVGALVRASACAHMARLIQRSTSSHIATCSLSDSTNIFDIIIKTARFSGGGGKLPKTKYVF